MIGKRRKVNGANRKKLFYPTEVNARKPMGISPAEIDQRARLAAVAAAAPSDIGFWSGSDYFTITLATLLPALAMYMPAPMPSRPMIELLAVFTVLPARS